MLKINLSLVYFSQILPYRIYWVYRFINRQSPLLCSIYFQKVLIPVLFEAGPTPLRGPVGWKGATFADLQICSSCTKFIVVFSCLRACYLTCNACDYRYNSTYILYWVSKKSKGNGVLERKWSPHPRCADLAPQGEGQGQKNCVCRILPSPPLRGPSPERRAKENVFIAREAQQTGNFYVDLKINWSPIENSVNLDWWSSTTYWAGIFGRYIGLHFLANTLSTMTSCLSNQRTVMS